MNSTIDTTQITLYYIAPQLDEYECMKDGMMLIRNIPLQASKRPSTELFKIREIVFWGIGERQTNDLQYGVMS